MLFERISFMAANCEMNPVDRSPRGSELPEVAETLGGELSDEDDEDDGEEEEEDEEDAGTIEACKGGGLAIDKIVLDADPCEPMPLTFTFWVPLKEDD